MTNNEVDYILVVEDSPDMQKLMCLYLDYEDFEVLTAADGYDAIKKVMKFRPKVVLTKGYFNNEDEFGLIKTIRHTKELPAFPWSPCWTAATDTFRPRRREPQKLFLSRKITKNCRKLFASLSKRSSG
jgi:CheY-like chemotaxis protein